RPPAYLVLPGLALFQEPGPTSSGSLLPANLFSLFCRLAIHPAGTAHGFGMGDLRNKARKLEEEARIKAMQARLEAKPKGEPIRCQCGLTSDQVPTGA